MMSIKNQTVCPVCKSTDNNIFFSLSDMPHFCNILWESGDKAGNCPKGDIDLRFCRRCSFIWNSSYVPSELDYSVEYENSLHYSPRFQEYAYNLAERLVENLDLKNKDIIEIGCGKGDFLVMLSDIGGNRGIGFDKSYQMREEHETKDQKVKFIQDFYSEEYSRFPADLVVSRHVLEHIEDPVAFLKGIRRIIDNPILFFEVPNGEHTFRNMAVWDIIYEHPNYFSPVSLKTVFHKAGFSSMKVSDEFGHQFLSILSTPGEITDELNQEDKDGVKRFQNDIELFTEKFNSNLSKWKDDFKQILSENKKTVIWGSGSKGVTFLNIMNLSSEVPYAVDINPRKHGKFIPGTAQKIVPPEFLKEYQPDVIIIMNPIYEDEIKEIASEMGLESEFLVV